MINKIVATFKDVCRKHKLIKSFIYNRTYELGGGNDVHPLVWLEEPIYLTNFAQSGAGFQYQVNFSVLLIPKQCGLTFQECQNLALSAGLNIIEYFKKYYSKRENKGLFKVRDGYSGITLQHYYDDDAAGARFSVVFEIVNPTNICLLDEQFDEDKEFEVKELINDFTITPANNCTTFVDKLPDFNIPTTR